MKKTNVLILEPSSSWNEEGATITALADGGMTIAVAEEKAVDSYNQTFECTITLTKKQAWQLRDWITTEVLG